jgi:Mycobacterium membrane protein
MEMSASRRTAAANTAMSISLLVMLVLTGCVWTEDAPVPPVATGPAPESAEPESPTPPSSSPTPPATSPAPATPMPTSPAPQVPAPGPPSNGSTVVYSVEGTGTASISHMTVQGGSVVQESASGTILPFSKTLTITGSGGAASAVLTLIAAGNQDTATLSCTITRDGEVVAEQTSAGPFATVTCSSTDG